MFHGGVEACKYKLKAKKFFREPVMHQIYKGVCINRSASKTGFLMNSKAEYHQGQVFRLVIDQGLKACSSRRTQTGISPCLILIIPLSVGDYFFICWDEVLLLLTTDLCSCTWWGADRPESLWSINVKIPHTRDKASLDRCG